MVFKKKRQDENFKISFIDSGSDSDLMFTIFTYSCSAAYSLVLLVVVVKSETETKMNGTKNEKTKNVLPDCFLFQMPLCQANRAFQT